MRIRIEAIHFDAPCASTLRAEAEDELVRRYRGADDSEGGAPSLTRDEVLAFLIARGPDGTALGAAALCRLDGDAAEIKRLYVRPAARRRGVGRALLAALEAHARAGGYRTLRLETGTRQPEAIKLYERSGYVPIEAFGFYSGSTLARAYERRLEGVGR